MSRLLVFGFFVVMAGALASSPSVQQQCPSNQWFSTLSNPPSCQPLTTIIVSDNLPAPVNTQLSTPPSSEVSNGYSSNTAIGGSSTQYDSIIQDCASQFNVDPNLVKAVVRVESDFNPNAVSSVGAEGLMQLMPSTFNSLTSGDIFDPRTNVCAGTEYLAQQLSTFGGNVELALAAYNAGPGAVIKYNNQIPNYPETVNYVASVDSYYHSYSA